MHVKVSEMLYKTGATKGYSSSLIKKKVMAINEDPFPLVASINTVNFDPRALIKSKKAGKLSPRKVWALSIVWFVLIG